MATLLGMTGMSEAVAQDTKDILPGVSVENFNMNRNGKYLSLIHIFIIDLFRKTAEADGEICGTDAYRRWLKSVQG